MKRNFLFFVFAILFSALLTTCKKDDSGSIPVADFTGTPTAGTSPLQVSFTDLSTNNSTSWQWNFGDGNSSTLKNPEHTYQNAGTYAVKLTAINSHGSNTHTRINYITVNASGSAPVADFAGLPTSGSAPLIVNFTDQSINNPTGWQWNFGDGNSSTMQNPAHTYQNSGTYAVQLTVSNANGNDTEIKSDYIKVDAPGNAPVAAFTGTPISGSAPLTVNFTDQSTDYPTDWQWDFGDGDTSAIQNPNHTYSQSGTYTVELTVTNNFGSGNKQKTNYINVTSSGGTGTVTDLDGNVYQTVIIGNQEWMAENLKYLPFVSAPDSGSTTVPYYYVYGYDGTLVAEAKATANYINYGVLYNWTAATNACPAGWHLPGDAEWTELTDYLGGYYTSGGKLKEIGTAFWLFPNTGATNESGFSSRPGGLRNGYGSFINNGGFGFWWSSSEYTTIPYYAWYRQLSFDNTKINNLTYYKDLGLSVRCVKD